MGFAFGLEYRAETPTRVIGLLLELLLPPGHVGDRAGDTRHARFYECQVDAS